MDRIAEDALNLPANSIEKIKLYEDPLGALSLAEQSLRERLKRIAPPWAQDSDGFFLSPERHHINRAGPRGAAVHAFGFQPRADGRRAARENRAVRAFRATQSALERGAERRHVR